MKSTRARALEVGEALAAERDQLVGELGRRLEPGGARRRP